jgi:hypothetical protein
MIGRIAPFWKSGLKLALAIGFVTFAFESPAAAVQSCPDTDCTWHAQGQQWCVADGDCVEHITDMGGGVLIRQRSCCECWAPGWCTMEPADPTPAPTH